MKKIIPIILASLTTASTAIAQETYESATIATEDLNGTARYIGMGGAMEALGADISTMSTNPAGIGLFRRSSVSGSFGLTALPSAMNGNIDGKTVASLDQLGFVISMPSGQNSIVNLGLNYRKSRNFNQILAAANALNHASQHKNSYIKGVLGAESNGGYSVGINKNDECIGYENSNSTYAARTFAQSDYMNLNCIAVDDDGYGRYFDANSYFFNRDREGYISEFDINLSGNYANRIYWGLTFSLHDVHYNDASDYVEFINSDDALVTIDNRTITGSGISVKGGIIARPIEDSPLRFGLSISSPTFYTLTSSNSSFMSTPSELGYSGGSDESYKYKMYTPWKFGLSAGHTIGTSVALGLSYEYTDYSTIDNRYITDENYYYDGGIDYNSKSDRAMNNHTKKSLKGVSTVKVGGEFKATPELSLRAGYNYVSSMYKDNAYRDLTISSDGVYFSSTTDFTNWKDTHRITCGVGYAVNNFSIDLAYMYSTQKGDFYPFQSMEVNDGNGKVANYAGPTKVENNRHQLTCTLGYRF